MRIFTPALLFAALLLPASVPLAAQELQNPGFEEANRGLAPVGWFVLGGDDYRVSVDRDVRREGGSSVRVEGASQGQGFGGLGQRIQAEPFRGHGAVLRGFIRAEEVRGHAGLWLRVDGSGQMISLDNMSDRGPSGTTGWAPFEIRAEVPTAAEQILLGVLLSGAGTGWFDGLTLEVDSTVTAEEWEAEPLEPPDSTLPDENPDWVEHARSTGWPVESLDGEDFSDLAFLREVIGDRRIVQLGESGHGVAEFNRAKVRLIEFLHREMGFDVVAFESSLFECWRANELADSLSPPELMRHCIFGVWHTEEVLELFRYIKETRSTERPLRLAGFDVQISTGTAGVRPDFWRRLLTPVSPERAAEAASLDSTFLALRRDEAELSRRREELSAGYRDLERFVEENREPLAEAHADSAEIVGLARRLAASTVSYIEQLTGGGGARTLARDRGMAENLDFLLRELYPEAKIVTWGHNFHLRHANQEVEPSPVRTMGSWVVEDWRSELYTVGLYARRGRMASNSRNVYNVLPPETGSLESILGHVGEPHLWVDLARTGEGEGGSWVHLPVVARSWGTNDVTLVPGDQYDAILFIDRVSAPDYVSR